MVQCSQCSTKGGLCSLAIIPALYTAIDTAYLNWCCTVHGCRELYTKQGELLGTHNYLWKFHGDLFPFVWKHIMFGWTRFRGEHIPHVTPAALAAISDSHDQQQLWVHFGGMLALNKIASSSVWKGWPILRAQEWSILLVPVYRTGRIYRSLPLPTISSYPEVHCMSFWHNYKC